MFKKSFKVVEIRNNGGVIITHYFNENSKEIKKIIEAFKKGSKGYELFRKEGMTVWY